MNHTTNRRLGPAILSLIAVCAPTAPARTEDAAAKQALAAQQGTWVAVSSRRAGQDVDPAIARTIQRVVEGNRAVWSREGKRFAGSVIFLDASKNPPTIDVVPEGGPARDERVLGIYRQDGDQLTICMADAGQPRPRTFSAEPGENQTLMTFERVNPAPLPPQKPGNAGPRP